MNDTAKCWGARWRSENRLDGQREYLLSEGNGFPVLFRTRAKARLWIEYHYGYIRTRPDLCADPHGWRMPVAVRVEVRRVAN